MAGTIADQMVETLHSAGRVSVIVIPGDVALRSWPLSISPALTLTT